MKVKAMGDGINWDTAFDRAAKPADRKNAINRLIEWLSDDLLIIAGLVVAPVGLAIWHLDEILRFFGAGQ